jgi:hypothetical protein
MLKLYYVNYYGRAEMLRLFLNLEKVAFEDVICTPDDMKTLKESGKLEFGQVPILEYPDGKIVC